MFTDLVAPWRKKDIQMYLALDYQEYRDITMEMVKLLH